VVFVLLLAFVGRCLWVFRDRNPGYALNLALSRAPSEAAPRALTVGFARAKITPDLSDPQRPVWLAGFSQNRAATAVHDDLWALACVLDDGYRRFGIVALDAIGLFHDDVLEVRRRLPAAARLDYALICATHNHSTPDLMGLWGPHPLRSGVDPRYRERVLTACVATLTEAAAQLRPALIHYHEIPTPPAGLLTDTRKPEVFDADLRLLRFTDPTTGAILGTILNWGNHPETVWSKNTEVTADFCGYLRDALEHGIVHAGRTLAPGVGGTHLFVNGAIGGLMTTSPSVTVRDPYLEQDFQSPTHDKARALGRQLASRLLPHLTADGTTGTNHAPISIHARTLELPVANPVFLLAPILGLLDRGHARWNHLRTEVALLTLGEASLACVPGEIYPEIVNGGIERPPGADFDLEPVEVPPLRASMPGRLKLVAGLANDEIGYLIPKSEWDRRPPYLYGASRPVYGEVNSVGPDAARLIHQALQGLCQTAQP